MKPRFFATPAAFRAWLEAHHASESELLVGYYKKGSGKPSITWPESVDEALCFGWIDGIRRRIDEQRYSIRFTPRRPQSVWSTRNIERMAVLEAAGRVRPAGRVAFRRRREASSEIYAYEQGGEAELEPAHEREFRARRQAWRFFQQQPPSYRRRALWWVVSAKREATRRRRLRRLIDSSAAGERAF